MFTEHVELTRYFHDFYMLREAASGLATGCREGGWRIGGWTGGRPG